MTHLKGSLAAKITAIVLSAVTAAAAVFSVVAVIFMLDEGFYTNTQSEVKKNVLDNRLSYRTADTIADLYHESLDYDEYASHSGVYYTVKNKSGETLATNYDGQKYLAERTMRYDWDPIMEYTYDDDGEIAEETVIKEYEVLEVTVYFPDEASLSEGGRLLLLAVDRLYPARFGIIAVGVAAILLTFALLCLLYAAVGHRSDGTVQLNHLDRVPFDLLTTALAVILAASGALLSDAAYNGGFFFLTVCAVIFVLDYFTALGYTLTFATRLKTKTLIKNNIIYKLLRFCGKYIKKFCSFVGFLFKNLSPVKKTALICTAVFVCQFIVMLTLAAGYYAADVMLVFWCLITVLEMIVVIYLAIVLSKIKAGGERIAGGDLTHKIDTAHMQGDFKAFAESLNHINDGLSRAVEEKMKSERFKTELITNVSHDIKTPLTSIINYVDLIKKEEIDNETAREYVAVLDRQSNRLKKLIEDLVEASKASTGNLAVNLTACDAGVLLSQTVGEFDERLAAAGLTPVLNTPEQSVKIMADGRHLWRVFDNLMSNVCKYSLRGTRVYMDVAEQDGRAVITFRNISAYQLNISSEELMERFVRGDTSRSTEGSGLGLSIARSLTELQNGTLDLEVDGDLFKVILRFDKI